MLPATRRDVQQPGRRGDEATIFKPGGGEGDSDLFAAWRMAFSDHFPLSFEMEIQTDTDVDFFK